MGWRSRPKFHGLKRFKARQTWNKYNLYNVSRLQTPPAAVKTFFQQKWLAKSLTRAYHGEYVREGQWELMFSKRIPAVVPMDHKYLANSDGSDEAAGRGSGVDRPPTTRKRESQTTPYMQMVYGPLERRLDQAIFRALFASSSRQAKQFVTHGHVKVNGKRMLHPGYLLNPGDMFQVDIDSVMAATGAQKNSALAAGAQMGLDEGSTEANTDETSAAEEAVEEVNGEAEEDLAVDEDVLETLEGMSDAQRKNRELLKSLRDRTRNILTESAKSLSGRQKQTLRALARSLRGAISKTSSATASSVEDLEGQFNEATRDIEYKDASRSDIPEDISTPKSASDSPILKAALAEAEENPVDPSKPYATPWRPRDYIAPFAFIPRYLEVNQNICAAVYLRHPVARPGKSEVPSPWGFETGQLAFNWYLRRR